MLTAHETALIRELEDAGFVYCESRETELEDGTILVELLLPLVEEGVEDTPEAVAAALEDMGVTAEDLAGWEF